MPIKKVVFSLRKCLFILEVRYVEGTRTDTEYVGRDSPAPIATDAQAVLSTFSGQSDSLFKICIFLQLPLFYSVFDVSPHALQMKDLGKIQYKCLLPIYVFPEVKLHSLVISKTAKTVI
jgi:hypothetical protein